MVVMIVNDSDDSDEWTLAGRSESMYSSCSRCSNVVKETAKLKKRSPNVIENNISLDIW